MTETRKLRVFLCHSSQDKSIVRELYQRLLAEGWIDPWLDEEKLLPGQNFDMEIGNAVETADAVIICLSNNSVTKNGYIQKELRKILDVADQMPEETVFVIPIRFDNCVIPRKLQLLHYVDYFPDERKEVSLQKLLQTLRPPFDEYNENLKQLEKDLIYLNEQLEKQFHEILMYNKEVQDLLAEKEKSKDKKGRKRS